MTISQERAKQIARRCRQIAEYRRLDDAFNALIEAADAIDELQRAISSSPYVPDKEDLGLIEVPTSTASEC